jgi:molybdopterin-guanine dinucleotide biosynthesis protein B
MPSPLPPVLGFAAFSGTGKTTLLTKLIPALKNRGIRVGVIKHSHHDFEIDYPGKDSHRLRSAGATPLMIVSPYRRVMIEEFDKRLDVDLQQQLACFPNQEIDLLLIEGFRNQPIAKIELHRPSQGKPLLYPDDPNIIAIAADQALPLPETMIQLDLNNPETIADFIVEHFLHTARD